MDYEFFSFFFVMNSCEPDYSDSEYFQEYWGVYTSLAFLVPAFIRLVLCGFSPVSPKLRRCYKALILVAFASGLFHTYVSYPTQAIDMTAILIAELCFAEALGLVITRYQEVFMVLSYFTILFTPVFTSIVIFLLFVQFSAYTIRMFRQEPRFIIRIPAIVSLLSIIGALLCIPLDMICDSPLLYHAYWHLLIAVYCFSGAISIELLYNLDLVKSD
mmetsp:Transcript_23580/g.41795  ORF Transcript_23580/g.41795 Transcript_23580/m.41795 type:complete len:216 (-) Transcript_23580:457-1104(-)